jgi:hypothetical protein
MPEKLESSAQADQNQFPLKARVGAAEPPAPLDMRGKLRSFRSAAADHQQSAEESLRFVPVRPSCLLWFDANTIGMISKSARIPRALRCASGAARLASS